MALRYLIGISVGILVAEKMPQLIAEDVTKDSPMYSIGEPQSAVPPKFRQSNAADDLAMTKKVEDALKARFPHSNLYITTTTEHIVYLRGFTQSDAEMEQIVALATTLASPNKIKNDLRVDMFARPGPMNGTGDK
jgi:osmotically-inducible protein OsmY